MSMNNAARYGIAEDAKKGLAHHLRRGPQLRGMLTNHLAPTQGTGDDTNGNTHESLGEKIYIAGNCIVAE